MKKIRQYLGIVSCFTLMVFLLMACGGGSGGGSGAVPTKSITGIASKGPLDGATVTIYALADGKPGTVLGTGKTNSDGSYSIDVNYTGNVLVEVTDGTYKDEATGLTTNNETSLRAVLANVSASVAVAVTPLTEVAVRLSESGLTIDQANSLVGAMVGFNIISTMPANVTDGTAVTASIAQVNYGLMLATISQMINDEAEVTDVAKAIELITADLKEDGQLETTGAMVLTALNAFLGNDNNESGVATLEQTSLDSALVAIIAEPVTPPENASDVIKAKNLVQNLRDTGLTIYNYQGYGMKGIVETPFANVAAEIETTIAPELSAMVDRLGWLLGSAGEVEYGNSYEFNNGTQVLTMTLTSENDISFDVKDGDQVIDSGEFKVHSRVAGEVTSGTAMLSMKTETGIMAVDLAFNATMSNSRYSSMTLKGKMTSPVLSFDFSEGDRKLHATWVPTPDNHDVYPQSITFSGILTTATAKMSGGFKLETVWNLHEDDPMPKSAEFTGAFSEIKDGALTGVNFSGTIKGTWSNAATYNTQASYSPANFPKWSATFDGMIEAPARPKITAFLKVDQNQYMKYLLDVDFKKTNPDKTISQLYGSGNFDDAADTVTVNLTNQDGLKISLVNDTNKPKGEAFTGTIKTAGGVKLADLYTIEGIPMVKYTDNYIESIF